MGTSTAFQIAIAAMFSELIEKMKASNSPVFAWVTAHTEFLNKVLAVVVGVLTAIGITTGWVVDPETGLGTLTLGGIPTTLGGWSTILVVTFEQYWLMKGWYKGLIKGTSKSAAVRNFAKSDPQSSY